MNEYENATEARAVADAEGGASAPIPVVEEIKPKKAVWGFRQEHLIEKPTGINQLFQTFTMQNETINNLKGQNNEISDLNKIVGIYKNWHLQLCPKLEYHHFLEKVQKMDKKMMPEHLNKLRRHYDGEELMEEFNIGGTEDVNDKFEKLSVDDDQIDLN